MKGVIYLAWRYVAYHRLKTVIMTLGLALTIVLPLSAQVLITQYGAALTARARATPLTVGAKGNRYDLVLKALYFSDADVETLHMGDVEQVRESGLALPIPLHLRFTARGVPIVGASPEYFEFRGLQIAAGTRPLLLGQAVLGARAAQRLKLKPGDTLFSDQRSLYDIARTYPLKMHIVGVLAPSDTPDDDAVFMDLKTAWIIEGLVHGHQDVSKTDDPSVILKRSESEVVTNAAIFEYNEVTPQNIASFHVHATPEDLPISAILVVPNGLKSATMLKARYSVSETRQMLVPTEVVDQLLGLVFQVKRFFDANFALILIATALFLGLIVMLSQRIRQREMETMFKIGCRRRVAIGLQSAELLIVAALSLILAGGLAALTIWLAPRLVGIA